jgi:hypothetical protein
MSEQANHIYVECMCGQTHLFPPEDTGEVVDCSAGCGRELTIPDPGFNALFRPLVRKFNTGGERERVQAIEELARLGSAYVLPVLVRGAHDAAREVVNRSIKALLSAGDFSREHVVELIQTGGLTISRLVAMIRELEWWEGAEVVCDLIDAGKLNEGQISETVVVLGEAKRARCISTLSGLRRAYPNLSMLVDNSLANYRHLDSQVNKIPDAAKEMAAGAEAKIDSMADSKRTAPQKKGCLVLLVALFSPAVAWLVWRGLGG